ncbi:MAG: hypothetical protein PUC97_01285 [bacterium]|nr:hypothetical protein [bacterium]
MKYAVVKDDMVENVIVADEAQKEELEAALCAELVDAQPLGLQIGDLRVVGKWTRNQDGEQIMLTEKPTYDELLARLEDAETALALLGVVPEVDNA